MRKSKTVPSRKVACNSPTPPHPYLGKAVNLTCICQMFHRANSNFHLFKGSKSNTNSERIASVPLSAIVKYNTKIFSKPSTISRFFTSIPRKFSSLSSAFFVHICQPYAGTYVNNVHLVAYKNGEDETIIQVHTTTSYITCLSHIQAYSSVFSHPFLQIDNIYQLMRELFFSDYKTNLFKLFV